MTDGSIPGAKRCAHCGGEYFLAFFRRSTNTNGSRSLPTGAQLYRDRCIGCETSSKSGELLNGRLHRKAVATRRRHGVKLKELGVLKDPDDLEEVYGWSLDRMMDDIRRVITTGCPYCLQPVSIAEQGLGIVTLDILNPDQEPHYSTNVHWCCARCNSEKQRTSSAVWGARLSMWGLWRLNQVRLEANPEEFGFLPFSNKADPSLTLW